METEKPKKELKNYAFIDSQNLNLSIQAQGWKLDFRKFKSYLQSKFGVSKAFLFIGFLEEQKDMYQSLREVGYTLVFKPTVTSGEEVKGNVDAELVLQTMIEYPNYNQAVIVSGDGDFYTLVQYLMKQEKLESLIVPNQHRYSSLFNEGIPEDKIHFLTPLKLKLAYKSARPTIKKPSIN